MCIRDRAYPEPLDYEDALEAVSQYNIHLEEESDFDDDEEDEEEDF